MFDEWLDRFVIFLKGYYCGLSVEERCRPGTEIIKEAMKSYKCMCHENDWIEEKD